MVGKNEKDVPQESVVHCVFHRQCPVDLAESEDLEQTNNLEELEVFQDWVHTVIGSLNCTWIALMDVIHQNVR